MRLIIVVVVLAIVIVNRGLAEECYFSVNQAAHLQVPVTSVTYVLCAAWVDATEPLVLTVDLAEDAHCVGRLQSLGYLSNASANPDEPHIFRRIVASEAYARSAIRLTYVALKSGTLRWVFECQKDERLNGDAATTTTDICVVAAVSAALLIIPLMFVVLNVRFVRRFFRPLLEVNEPHAKSAYSLHGCTIIIPGLITALFGLKEAKEARAVSRQSSSPKKGAVKSTTATPKSSGSHRPSSGTFKTTDVTRIPTETDTSFKTDVPERPKERVGAKGKGSIMTMKEDFSVAANKGQGTIRTFASGDKVDENAARLKHRDDVTPSKTGAAVRAAASVHKKAKDAAVKSNVHKLSPGGTGSVNEREAAVPVQSMRSSSTGKSSEKLADESLVGDQSELKTDVLVFKDSDASLAPSEFLPKGDPRV